MIPLYLYNRIQKEKQQATAAMAEEDDTEQEYVEPKRVSPFVKLRAFAGAIGRSAASAGSLLADSELRGQARAVVSRQAGQSISSLREGVQYETEYLAKRLNSGLGYVQQGPKQVQSILTRLQKRIEDTRLQALLEAERDAPVDVQIGPQLVEEAPQELRSRLWLALLANPDLCCTYQDGQVLQAQPALSALGTSSNSRSSPSSFSSFRSSDSFVPVGSSSHIPNVDKQQASQQPAAETALQSAVSSVQPEQVDAATTTQPNLSDPFQQSVDALHGQETLSPSQDPPLKQTTTGSQNALNHINTPSNQDAAVQSSSQKLNAKMVAIEEQEPSNEGPGIGHSPSVSSSAIEASIAATSPSPVGSASTDAWEMVQDSNNINNWKAGSMVGRSLSSRVRQGSDCSEEGESYSQRLMDAITKVTWPITHEYSEDSRYNTLLQISVGQEEVDEVIGRDINRTFPEHPQFGFEQGQQALYRVLKAYSLHDLEVGYCQGMAFVAGVILMYLPEEPAFRVLCQLLDEGGVGLRSLYLPGLCGLKEDLRMLDWLMDRLMPQLKQHLENYGAVPVLYASQWFLTVYSCPFPATFSCRVIDVMLTEHSPNILMRAALAVLAECEEDLLQLHDFEDLITYLKVEPVQWSADHTRTVLTSAISSPAPFCSIPMIEAAKLAVQQGYEGTMHRRASSVSEIAAAVSQAAAAGVIASTAGQAENEPAGLIVTTDSTQQQNDDSNAELQPSDASHGRMLGSQGSSKQQNGEVDPDQVAMRIALDVLWTGGGSGAAQSSKQASSDDVTAS